MRFNFVVSVCQFFSLNVVGRLIELQENGLFNYWDLWFRPMPRKCLPNIEGTTKNGPVHGKLRRLSLKNLTGAFAVLTIGMLISFSAFLVEFLTKKTNKQQ